MRCHAAPSLPILLDNDNVRRTEPNIAIPEDYIYRDTWAWMIKFMEFDYFPLNDWMYNRDKIDNAHQNQSAMIVDPMFRKVIEQRFYVK